MVSWWIQEDERWRRRYTTTNQKHAKTVNDGTDRRWDCGGARGRWNIIVSGEIVINSIIKILINCC
jgi:hypothetical protein